MVILGICIEVTSFCNIVLSDGKCAICLSGYVLKEGKCHSNGKDLGCQIRGSNNLC